MIRNLHHSCDTQSILNDLKVQTFNVLNAINQLKWKIKEPLDIFILVFDTTENIRKIHQFTPIKVEPIKASKLIPQCRCKRDKKNVNLVEENANALTNKPVVNTGEVTFAQMANQDHTNTLKK